MTTYYDVIETRFGWMGLLRSEKGLMRTTLPQIVPDRCIQILGAEMAGAEHAPERFTSLAGSLSRYFEGDKLRIVEETLDLEGATPFHRQAWQACMSIPFGETRTYKWLAIQAGKPNAPRAAGQSMARNRLPIVVPCHRVITADGGLRGLLGDRLGAEPRSGSLGLVQIYAHLVFEKLFGSG